MGALLCSLREPSLKKILKDGFNTEPTGGVGCTAYQCSATDRRRRRSSSLIKMKSYWCLKTQKRNRQLHPALENDEKKINKQKKLTLEDCLVASSPAGLIKQDSFIIKNGGNLLHGRLSSEVLHPSMNRIHPQFMISASHRELGLVEGNENNEVLNRSQSERSNNRSRRVSFRMPADVIIFYPDHEE